MKIFLSICTLALGLSLTSCDLSMLTNRSETNRIERGMTKREVTNILGTPSYRRLATDGSEDWEYRRTNILGETSVVVVTFYDNRVVRMDSYNGDDWERRRSQRDYPSYPSNPTYPSNPRYPSYPQDPRYEDERDRESFEDFLRAIADKHFTKDKIRFIRDAARRNVFTVAQTARILRLFTWDSEKLEVLEALAPRLRDGYNAYKLVDLFTFSDNQEQARRILGLTR